MKLAIKRVYEMPDKDDGVRILVDRVWPRGLTKEKAHVDIWLKEIAPGTTLRKWFGHDPAKWEEFREQYLLELRKHPEELKALEVQLKNNPVTLLYGAKDEEHNQAVVLKELLNNTLYH